MAAVIKTGGRVPVQIWRQLAWDPSLLPLKDLTLDQSKDINIYGGPWYSSSMASLVLTDSSQQTSDKVSYFGSFEEVVSVKVFEEMKEEVENISLVDLHLLVEVLHTAAAEIETNHLAVCPVVKECFRSLRNSCVDASEVQTVIAEKTTALDDTKTILQSLSRLQDNINTIVVQVGVQFLGNLIVNNLNNQTIVWKKLSDVLKLFTIQLLLAKEGYLKSVYHKLKLEHNLFILEAIHAMIATDPDEVWKSSDVPTSSIEFLIYEFKRHPMCVFQPCRKSEEEMEPKVAAKLLEIIASASGDNRYLKDLQKDSNLLVDCICKFIL
uniref:Uncharacterized protein n=1 Tax=Timema monikensis TaxID=170555 RepID=A0A7R9ED65_9NEOP|nr:unnamed protein product [Timema monikensis]